MDNSYPVRFPAQLRQHLRALRKKRGLTQANVAALIGVSQARIAEIEANPGLVSFDQLMQLFAALGATLTICETVSSSSSGNPEEPSQFKTGAVRPVDRIQKNAETKGEEDTVRKTLDSLASLEDARQALRANSSSDAARKALSSLGGLEQARKALEANSSSDAARKALSSLSSLEQARKALEVNNTSEVLRKALRDADALQSYRNALIHLKKGNW